MYDINQHVLNSIVRKAILQNKHQNITTVLGITGNIASGKTEFAKQLKQTCQTLFPDQSVQVISTDNFLQTNQELMQKNIFSRKGFPESYRTYLVNDFVDAIINRKSITLPEYSHTINDIDPSASVLVNCPDILIIEGLIVLHSELAPIMTCSIFLEANITDNYRWFEKRCHHLNLKKLYNLNEQQFHQKMIFNWEEINLKNYYENILPFKLKATFQLHLDSNHRIRSLTIN